MPARDNKCRQGCLAQRLVISEASEFVVAEICFARDQEHPYSAFLFCDKGFCSRIIAAKQAVRVVLVRRAVINHNDLTGNVDLLAVRLVAIVLWLSRYDAKSNEYHLSICDLTARRETDRPCLNAVNRLSYPVRLFQFGCKAVSRFGHISTPVT